MGANFLAPKSGHRHKKQPVLGPRQPAPSSAFSIAKVNHGTDHKHRMAEIYPSNFNNVFFVEEDWILYKGESDDSVGMLWIHQHAGFSITGGGTRDWDPPELPHLNKSNPPHQKSFSPWPESPLSPFFSVIPMKVLVSPKFTWNETLKSK